MELESQIPNANNTNCTSSSSYKDSKKLSLGDNNNWDIVNRNNAGIRVFGSLLLNAWRKQREDGHLVAKKVSKYKYSCMKAKETIKFLDSVILVEKEHNEKLFNELKTFSNELDIANNTNVKLKDTITDLESKGNAMNDKLSAKNQEYQQILLAKNQEYQQILSAKNQEYRKILTAKNLEYQQILSAKNQEYEQILSAKNQEYQQILAKLLKSQEDLKKMHEYGKRLENEYNLSKEKVTQLVRENVSLTRSLADLKLVVSHHSDELSRNHASIVSTYNELDEIKSEFSARKDHIDNLFQMAAIMDTISLVTKSNHSRVDTVRVNYFRQLYQWTLLMLRRLFSSLSPIRVAPAQTITQVVTNAITLDTVEDGIENAK